jgi:YrbI family 3-deoxy-D-manno-octulosonate 8-phosphate phosphatase
MSTAGRAISEALVERIRRVRLIAFDFDGVFTDNAVYVMPDGTEAVRCWRSDGLGLAKLAALNIEAVVISTETNPIVSVRTRKLGIRCLQGLEDKRAALLELLREQELGSDEVAYVGNDINDLGCLRSVGLPIVVEDADPAVLGDAAYRTTRRGGYGAVREVCDLFERALGERS